MNLSEVRKFVAAQPWAVEASCSAEGVPQAAVIGIAISNRFELVFDTLVASRKHANLLQRPIAALVVGWDAAITVQIEGRCDQPVGQDLTRIKDCYFQRFADGRDRASRAEIAYWRVAPEWIRYSDFNVDPPRVVEWSREDILAYVDSV